MIGHRELRKTFNTFWEEKDHAQVQPFPLVLQGDATTLFTSSGMQPLVPYLMGKEHPSGKRIVDIQPCIRTGDIEDVGDDRHTTFFEMMGNWSLGDYYKKEQISWVWEFFTKALNLPKEKLFITVFNGNDEIPMDQESLNAWKELGVKDDHIVEYGDDKNWWSRSGPPSNMPAGEIGGPSSEIFYEFDIEHNSDFGDECHPNCDCGKFIEIGNSVFIQYKKESNNTLVELKQKSVDYGGGLERILAAQNNTADIFLTDLFYPIIEGLERITKKKYSENKETMQVIADHMRAAIFLIDQGVVPANKEHGYILRRLLRRSAVKLYQITNDQSSIMVLDSIVKPVISIFTDIYFDKADVTNIKLVISNEMRRFDSTLQKGLKEISKLETIDGKTAFNLFQSYGFPLEITEEIAIKENIKIDIDDFKKAQDEHRELSRSASAGKFKGGLADTSDQVIKYHTATHILHQALKDVFGDIIRQEGSNITQERLRFDTRLDRKPTDEEIQKVEEITNSKIAEGLPVYFKMLPKEEANELGASSFFKEKYDDIVKVYFVGGNEEDYSKAYSMEFCGGPHVTNTREIGTIKITKVKKIGSQLVRIYAQ